MKTTHIQSKENNSATNKEYNNEPCGYILLDALRYTSPTSNQEFEIDSKDNLHITEHSILKNRNDIVPLDLINPQPVVKTRLNKSLMLIALASALVSGAFFASAIYMGQVWAVTFSLVFWVFGIGTIIASYRKRSQIYQYYLTNTNTHLFTLSETITQNTQVELFINALNKRINKLNKNNEEFAADKIDIAQLDVLGEKEIYAQDKQSQYLVHLDFLFNHGIVDDTLYKRLHNKINNKIADSENHFIKPEIDNNGEQKFSNNVIKFPVNA